ncbi:MAG: ketopantoate reductase family protein, partial [Anaerolineales bacterium]
MRYLVYGTGAIGGLIGGTLAAHGGVVTFLARPRSAAHLRQRGLQVRNGGDTFSVVAPQVVTSPTEGLARTPDAILLAVKSQSTSGVIDELQAAARPIPPVVCLQNGVD